MMKKLLIVDDETEILAFLKEFFEDRGYSVTTAASSDEARQALELEKPLVALLDIKMKTNEDGLELLRWIKEKSPKVKVIMVTSLEHQEIVEKAKSLGADDYITKPLELQYLETSVSEKVDALMKDHAHQSEKKGEQ